MTQYWTIKSILYMFIIIVISLTLNICHWALIQSDVEICQSTGSHLLTWTKFIYNLEKKSYILFLEYLSILAFLTLSQDKRLY